MASDHAADIDRHDAADIDRQHAADIDRHVRIYITVFVALMALTIITVTIMPIAFMLLFVYVFGGAIQAGTDNYVNYLMPGILLIAIAISVINMIMDILYSVIDPRISYE